MKLAPQQRRAMIEALSQDDEDAELFGMFDDETLMEMYGQLGNAPAGDAALNVIRELRPFKPLPVISTLVAERRAAVRNAETDRQASTLRGGDFPANPESQPFARGLVPPGAAGSDQFEDHVPRVMSAEAFLDRYVNSVVPSSGAPLVPVGPVTDAIERARR